MIILTCPHSRVYVALPIIKYKISLLFRAGFDDHHLGHNIIGVLDFESGSVLEKIGVKYEHRSKRPT
jgi:hypothetical protein